MCLPLSTCFLRSSVVASSLLSLSHSCFLPLFTHSLPSLLVCLSLASFSIDMLLSSTSFFPSRVYRPSTPLFASISFRFCHPLYNTNTHTPLFIHSFRQPFFPLSDFHSPKNVHNLLTHTRIHIPTSFHPQLTDPPTPPPLPPFLPPSPPPSTLDTPQACSQSAPCIYF